MRGPPITIDDRRTPRCVPPLGWATVPTPPGLFLAGLAAINRGRAAGWLKSACGRTCAQQSSLRAHQAGRVEGDQGRRAAAEVSVRIIGGRPRVATASAGQ